MKFFTGIILVLLALGAKSQTIFIGDKTYSSSDEIFLDDFNNTSSVFKTGASITFVKKLDGSGFLIFKFSGGIPNEAVKGVVTFYLDNDSLLKFIDRKKYDCANEECSTIYYLTASEIKKLKTTNIQAIRFSTSAGDLILNFENHIFYNKEKENKINQGKICPRIDFSKIVSSLFG